jgi:hypothetical protein
MITLQYANVLGTIMLGRVISFGGTAYIINTIALQRTNVLGTIVLERVVNLGGTTNITDTIIHCKNLSDTIVLGELLVSETQPTSPTR